MKFLLFIVILIIIYFLIMNFFIKKNKQPVIDKNENNSDKNENSGDKIHISLNNHIKKIKKIKKKPKKEKIKFMEKTKLIDIIKQKYLNSQYLFNLPNNPVITRYPTSNFLPQDSKYLKNISANIMKWNNILTSPVNLLFIDNIQPINVLETDNEFLIKVNVKLIYLNKSFYVQLIYYGLIDKMDDFFTSQDNTYRLQMVAMDEINNLIYQKSKEPILVELPFMTMEEQMNYVDKINKIHNEIND